MIPLSFDGNFSSFGIIRSVGNMAEKQGKAWDEGWERKIWERSKSKEQETPLKGISLINVLH